MDKQKLKAHTAKAGKFAAFMAVFGFTGLAAVGIFKLYKAMRGLEDINLDMQHSDYDGD